MPSDTGFKGFGYTDGDFREVDRWLIESFEYIYQHRRRLTDTDNDVYDLEFSLAVHTSGPNYRLPVERGKVCEECWLKGRILNGVKDRYHSH